MELPSDHHHREASLEKEKGFLEERQDETHQACQAHLRQEGLYEIKQPPRLGKEKEMGEIASRDPDEVDSDRQPQPGAEDNEHEQEDHDDVIVEDEP